MKKVLIAISKTIYAAVVLSVVLITLLFIGTKIDFFGYEARVVRSGSMEPAIPTGALVLIAPTQNYGVGDVITYETSARRSLPVTHRIIEVDNSKRVKYYTTKGDANQHTDPKAVAHPQLLGKVLLSIPYIGYAIEFARTPLGFALLIGIPAAVIILDEFANIMWEFHKYRHGLRRRRQGKVGYRQPSRERRPRDLSKPVSQPTKQTSSAVKPNREAVLDLRNYELNRRSV